MVLRAIWLLGLTIFFSCSSVFGQEVHVAHLDIDSGNACDITVGVDEPIEKLEVFPNPASYALSVVFPNADGGLQIFELSGKLILESSITQGINQIDLTKVQTGVYVLVVTTDRKIYQSKLFVNQ